jgi:hypothetical protein
LPKLPTGDNYWDTEEGVDNPWETLPHSQVSFTKYKIKDWWTV